MFHVTSENNSAIVMTNNVADAVRWYLSTYTENFPLRVVKATTLVGDFNVVMAEGWMVFEPQDVLVRSLAGDMVLSSSELPNENCIIFGEWEDNPSVVFSVD